MLIFCALWYVMVLVFARMPTHASGCVALAFTGLVQSMGMVSMSTMILRNAEAEFRGRVMGLRMLAIYGLPIGLLIAGQLIPRIGYAATATVYCALGLACTALIAMHWRTHVWRLQAAANAR
jgi:predicted MFS family arabinose efflux permease